MEYNNWDENYSAINIFFDCYVNSENSQDEMDDDGIEQLCNDIGIDMLTDIVILIIAWKCNATTMGVFTREEFHRGMSSIGSGCTTSASLKEKLPSLRQEIKQNFTSFQEMYIFCFSFAISASTDQDVTADQAHKDVNELPKVLPFDSAIAYWMLLLSNSWFALYLKWWIEFLNKDISCNSLFDHGISMDLWIELLKIVRFKDIDFQTLAVPNNKESEEKQHFSPIITKFILYVHEKRIREEKGPGVMVVMRHSVRLDDDGSAEWEDRMLRPYDTPIKDFNLPVLQTNELIKLNLNHFDTIICSPFRRCLQTAAIVVKTLHELCPENTLPCIYINKIFGEKISCVRRCQRDVWEEGVEGVAAKADNGSNKKADGKVIYLNEKEMCHILHVHSNGLISTLNGPVEGDTPNPKETSEEGTRRFQAALSKLGEDQCRGDGKHVLVIAHGDTVECCFRAFTSKICYITQECCFAAFSFQDEFEIKQIATSRLECL